MLGAISFDLPVWNRNVAGRGAASAREAARAYDADVVNAVKESSTLTMQAYQSGKIGLVELLLIRKSALDARRGEAEALTELAEAEAELLRALGGEQPERA